MLILFS